MESKQFPKQLEAQLPDGIARLVDEVTLPRTAAAGSLILSAYLLLAGRRKSALAAAITAGTIVALENPDATKQLWENIPNFLHQSHDFLMKLEDVISEVSVQGQKLRRTFARG
jgi:hypothetical protein